MGNAKKAGINGFACSCEGKFRGFHCNITNEAVEDMRKAGRHNTTVVAVVMSLLIVAIVGVMCYVSRRNDGFQYKRGCFAETVFFCNKAPDDSVELGHQRSSDNFREGSGLQHSAVNHGYGSAIRESRSS
ncbi:uncharacterized protein LOC129228179 [Uloborus diversus]|uniref:uncharacterized protein LOC129228179 n=1 Tax=Uloborus diversus TaxID=327109 RepID=UPI00240A1F3B|nr:uncharacterized protein LOC129228179 [Uloborus diversus]